MINKIKEIFNNSTDLKIQEIKNVYVIFLESLCSSDKINDYILKLLSLNKIKDISNVLAGPNTESIKFEDIENYLSNGFTVVIYKKEILAIETKGDLNRGIDIPQSQPAIYGPKDAFTESIQTNLGLIKRRIKTGELINKDIMVGKQTKTKVSIVYMNNICEQELVDLVMERINKIDTDGIIDSSYISQLITNENATPFPTTLESERPDKVVMELLEGKLAILVDTSPFALILPAFFVDFINPSSDNYNKSININILKITRFICYFISLILPAFYVALINYNQESIPLELLVSFTTQRQDVPIPTALEAFIMLFLCDLLRESDIRFPSSFGSSISILGALILGEAAVSASIVSPIMIIIVAITFITNLLFSDSDAINSIRLFRYIFLFFAVMAGLYGLVIAFVLFLIHLCSIKTFGKPYTYPLAPFNRNYLFKTILNKQRKKNTKRSRMLTTNLTKQRSE